TATMYDRRARYLSEDEVKSKLESGIPYVIRLKVPLNEEIKFNDIIRGTVKIDTNHIDDQILLKSDGFPTYHLANVIDDHLMEITHIIRGEEWITSVPKHILIYRAFGWEVPKMAHVPLILNPDKTKLSKRQGDVATEDYLKKGYLPEALVNYMALLGWNPGEGEKREIFSLDELIKLFTLERVNSSGAVFNIEKLNWMNSEYIKKTDNEKLAEMISPYLIKARFDVSDKNKLFRVTYVIKNYIEKLDEAPEYARIFYEEVKIKDEHLEIINNSSSRTVLSELSILLNETYEITETNFKLLLTEICDKTGIRGKSLFMPVRLALTGEEHGPELGTIAYVLGKEEVIRRIKKLNIQ
ncbi:MAG: glutamate--tRNA ligase, partial [Ignavibacteria bacterium]|nr:glutamate--tRNA ligase [Ignavibacteria bacterium]